MHRSGAAPKIVAERTMMQTILTSPSTVVVTALVR